MNEAIRANEVISRKSRRDLVSMLLLMVIIALLGWITWDRLQSQRRAEVAEATTVSLAEQIQAACLDDEVIVSDRDICDRADQVVDAGPTVIVGDRGPAGSAGLPGPAGTPGEDGLDGEDGQAGAPGAAGPTGLAGSDGRTIAGPPGVDGLAGQQGIPGADGAPGATGAAGPEGAVGPPGVDGAPGAAGEPGPAGRGVALVECQPDGAWLITYTDATTSSTPGPCRIDLLPEAGPIGPE